MPGTEKHDKNEILLGAGEVYMYEFDGKEIPEDSVIETEDHNVGHCQGGSPLTISQQSTM